MEDRARMEDRKPMESRTPMNLDLLARSLLATEGDAILAVDRQGRICFWNPGAVRIFGFSEPETLGASLDLIIPEGLRSRHHSGFERSMATGSTHYGAGDLLAVPATRKDGSRISVEFSICLLRGEMDEITGMAAILRDVSPRFEETRRLRRRLAELEASGPRDANESNAGGT